MATRAEARLINLKKALFLLKVTKREDGIRKVQTECMGRLGLGQKDYDFCCRMMNVPINREVISANRRKWRGEQLVKKVCNKLKISQSKLKERFERSMGLDGLNLTRNQNNRICKELGIKYDHQKRILFLRTDVIKKEETKIVSAWNKGKSYRTIASELNIPIGNLIQRVNKLRNRGIYLPLRAPGGFIRGKGFTVDNIGDLIRKGWRVVDIAARFGKKSDSFSALVCNWRVKFGTGRVPYAKKLIK